MFGQTGGLQTLIRQEYPFAFLFYCAAHRLNLVLCQCIYSSFCKGLFLQISVHLVLSPVLVLGENISFIHKALRFLILGIPDGATVQEPSVLSLINAILCCLFWRALLITHKAGMMGLCHKHLAYYNI